MKGAIASVEIFAQRGAEPVQRLSLVVGEPRLSTSNASSSADLRSSKDDAKWTCRVALANLHRPVTTEGLDSVDALSRAVAVGRGWLDALKADGFELYRDRNKERPYFID